MNRQFNLLPAHYAEQIAERRLARVTAAALVVVVATLAFVGVNQGRRLERAEKDRDIEQARTAALGARRGQLAPFRQLADGITARERLLAAAMGTEVSWGAVLASLAQSFPDDASLVSFTAESQLPPFGAPPGKLGNERSVIGSTALKGYSVMQFTPGVERILQRLVTVTGLVEPRLQLGTIEEMGEQPVTTFEGTAFVDGRALTGRYAQGLPAEDDVDVPAVGGGGAGSAPPAAAGPGGAGAK